MSWQLHRFWIASCLSGATRYRQTRIQSTDDSEAACSWCFSHTMYGTGRAISETRIGVDADLEAQNSSDIQCGCQAPFRSRRDPIDTESADYVACQMGTVHAAATGEGIDQELRTRTRYGYCWNLQTDSEVPSNRKHRSLTQKQDSVKDNHAPVPHTSHHFGTMSRMTVMRDGYFRLVLSCIGCGTRAASDFSPLPMGQLQSGRRRWEWRVGLDVAIVVEGATPFQ